MLSVSGNTGPGVAPGGVEPSAALVASGPSVNVVVAVVGGSAEVFESPHPESATTTTPAPNDVQRHVPNFMGRHANQHPVLVDKVSSSDL